MKNIQNASQMPKTYYARHMINGVAQYGATDEEERILVTTETIKKMMKTLNDCPVYVEHQDVDLENIQETADGYVTDSFYNEADGWFWCKFLAVSDAAHEAISKGWAVSNAYLPTEWANGGTFLNVPYDREVVNGDFNHLAIVNNPRYEDAKVMTVEDFKSYNDEKRQQLNELKNSKNETKKESSKMKIWAKKEVENSDDLSNTFVTLENGEDKSVKEMAELVNASIEKEKAENEKAEEEKKENMCDMGKKVKVGENEMTVEELKEAYENMIEKEEKANAKAADEEKEKANEAAEEEAKTKEKEEKKTAKKNAKDGEKHVDALKNSIAKGAEEAGEVKVLSRLEQVDLGKSKY